MFFIGMNYKIAIIGSNLEFLLRTFLELQRNNVFLKEENITFWVQSMNLIPENKNENSQSIVYNLEKSLENNSVENYQSNSQSLNWLADFENESEELAQKYLSKLTQKFPIPKIYQNILDIKLSQNWSKTPNQKTESKNLEIVKNQKSSVFPSYNSQKPQNQITNQENIPNSSQKWSIDNLKTDHLILRPISASHLEFVWQNGQKYTQKCADKAEFEKIFGDKLQQNLDKKRLDLIILDRENADFLGLVGLDLNQKNAESIIQIEMSFWLTEKVWNQGFGSEAVKIVQKWLQKNIPSHKIILKIGKNNAAAQRIAQKMEAKIVSEFSLCENGKNLDFVKYEVSFGENVDNLTKFMNQNNWENLKIAKNTKTENLDFENLSNLKISELVQKMEQSKNLDNENLILENPENITKNIIITTKNEQFEFDKIIVQKSFWENCGFKIAENWKNLEQNFEIVSIL